MPDFYSILVFLLFALAITDLVVGVANDAVNFLISAVGAKVAPRNVIMIVASIGIFVGASFSSGMMEVAKKGIFNPDQFVFSEVMIIFIAVMITDIILLDAFNSFGLPTSTTVSIVFEIMGAAVAVALVKMTREDVGLGHLSSYINTESALTIIVGILMSVGIAFTVGLLVQYISRIIFTFEYKKKLKWTGAVWGALSMAVLTHFLFVKGIKGAAFISKETANFITSGSFEVGGMTLRTIWIISLGSFLFWFILMRLVHHFSKFDVLKIVVLAGTFALAMAFAGNDLVNFIGVPIAGLDSYQAWVAEGVPAETFNMGFLKNAVPTQTYLLLIAGLVMVLTLWFSKKARTVTETSVNLSRQAEGQERFEPNRLSRGIVRGAWMLSSGVEALLPKRTKIKIARSFKPVPLVAEDGGDPPAFDMIRASVNLTVASMLISFATSLKLPLSTTYVTFMVAMGTSLADRAWGRESAVYRVAGVLNVVGGWFFTAFVAFTASAIFASIIYGFGGYGVGALVLVAVGLMSRSFFSHRKSEKEKDEQREFDSQKGAVSTSRVTEETLEKVVATLKTVRLTFDSSLQGLVSEQQAVLRKTKNEVRELKKRNDKLRYNLFAYISRIEETDAEGSRKYILVYDFEQDIVTSAVTIAKTCKDHVDNVHKPLDKNQAKLITEMRTTVSNYLMQVEKLLTAKDFSKEDLINEGRNNIMKMVEDLTKSQVKGIKSKAYGSRNSLLFFSLLLETKNLVIVGSRFFKFYAKEAEMVEGSSGD